MWKTWANLLTGLRLLSIVPCAWAIGTGQWTLAAGLFTLAVLTDLMDGPVARRYGHASPLGGLFDHATDALFVSVNLAALAWLGLVNPLLPLLVALAFLQYVFDSRALQGAVLRTSFLGKNNGIAYFVLVGVPVMRDALGWSFPPNSWVAAGGFLLLATTLVSMSERAIALIRRR
jgi:phosphatidylglycerophosphate synthase